MVNDLLRELQALGVPAPSLHANRTHVWVCPDYVTVAEAIHLLLFLKETNVRYASLSTEAIRAVCREVKVHKSRITMAERFLRRTGAESVSWNGCVCTTGQPTLEVPGSPLHKELRFLETLLQANGALPFSYAA